MISLLIVNLTSFWLVDSIRLNVCINANQLHYQISWECWHCQEQQLKNWFRTCVVSRLWQDCQNKCWHICHNSRQYNLSIITMPPNCPQQQLTQWSIHYTLTLYQPLTGSQQVQIPPTTVLRTKSNMGIKQGKVSITDPKTATAGAHSLPEFIAIRASNGQKSLAYLDLPNRGG